METVSLTDRQSGRSVTIRRSLREYIASDELMVLEETVWVWGNLATEEQAEEVFDRIAGGSPERALYGLLWITGVWCSFCHTRFGFPLADFVQRLDYQGLRRDLSGMDEQGWETVTHLVRRGVRAVIDSDADIREYLRIVKILDPSLLGIRRQLLIVLDGLTQNMQRNGIVPWGAAAHIMTNAGWSSS